MSWVKIDDGFADHPKILPLSDAAFRLHTCAMCWSNRRSTIGFISERDLPVLGAMIQQSSPERSIECSRTQSEHVRALIMELVNARSKEGGSGVWEPKDGGWSIHDFDEYQPGATEREQEKAAARERMRKLRAVRAAKANSSREQSGERSPHVRPPLPSPPPCSKEQEEDPPKAPQGALALEHPDQPKAPKKADVNRHIALTLLSLLNDRRRVLRPDCRGYGTQPSNLKHIEARLAEDYTAEQLRHVIFVWEAKCRRHPESFEWFTSSTPFLAKNIASYVDTPLEDAGRGFHAPSTESDEAPVHPSHIPFHETETYRREQAVRAELERETPEQRAARTKQMRKDLAKLGIGGEEGEG